MKIASRTVRGSQTQKAYKETLIQTDLGTYFIVYEDFFSRDLSSRKVSIEQACEFQKAAKAINSQEKKMSELSKDENLQNGQSHTLVSLIHAE